MRKLWVLLGALVVALALGLFKTRRPQATIAGVGGATEPSGSVRTAHSGSPATLRSTKGTSQMSRPPALVSAPVMVDYTLLDKVRSMFDASPVHDEQDRDPKWAPVMETTLQKRFEKDVQRYVPEAKVDVDCRTLSCRVELSGVPPDKMQSAWLGLRVAYVADILQFTNAINGNMVVVAFFGERNRDLDKWQNWYAESRPRNLQEMREANDPLFYNLPAE